MQLYWEIVLNRTKHLYTKLHYIREHALDFKTFKPEYISTKLMLADIMTKPLPRNVFDSLKNMILEFVVP